MYRLSALGSVPGLERIEKLLSVMGNPHEELNSVHIAGTNGKGTTSLIIADVLAKAGYKVGRFISPHLHSYLERVSINGIEIEAERFNTYLDQIDENIKQMVKDGYDHPTEFEILTALVFQYFKDERVDIAVLEVGMGGLYDSTNVVMPLLSVITGIGLDHTVFLGNSLEEVAVNKAGIIKKSRPVIAGEMDEKALDVLKDKAAKEGSELILSSQIKVNRKANPDIKQGILRQLVDIKGSYFEIKNLSFSLLGDFQLKNLATSIAALEMMKHEGYKIEENNIKESLPMLKMPGRFEIVRQKPLVIMDVAHNPQGAMAVASSLETVLTDQQKVLVCGLVDDKDFEKAIVPLEKNTRACVITRPEGSRGTKWQRVSRRWQELFPNKICYEVENISQAVEKGLALLEENEYLLVTGSFYVLDEARKYFVE